MRLIKKMTRVLPVLLLTLWLTPAQQAQESIGFETLRLGAFAGIPRPNVDENEVQVIVNERQLRKAWKNLYRLFPTPPPVPEVDFSERMVIILNYQQLPDASVSMTIADLLAHDDHLEIVVQETVRRGQTCPVVVPVTVFPFQVIETDILKKKFRKNIEVTAHTEVVECAPQPQ